MGLGGVWDVEGTGMQPVPEEGGLARRLREKVLQYDLSIAAQTTAFSLAYALLPSLPHGQ